MLFRRARLLLLAGGVCAAILPAVAQPPDSGLPPGFGDPKAPPPPTPPPPTVTPTIPTPTPTLPDDDADEAPTRPAPSRSERMPVEETTDSALTDLEMLPPPPPPPFYDLPEGEERPVDVVGLINITNRGLPVDAFGNASGPFLTTLMERLDAPLPSRWMHILLRRGLMSRVSAPRLMDPVDFVAERVRLLVRMGEADAARMLAQSIDVNSYNPNMVRAGYEAALATADPAGLCPLVRKGRAAFNDPAWPMAEAMCAALEGDAAQASNLLDQARSQGASGPDLLLAEKIIGAGINTRRSVSIKWDEIQDLNPWRFGLATATGSVLPDRLLNAAPLPMKAWLARAPMVPVSDRLAAADVAAALGVFSAESLVEAHALALQMNDGQAPEAAGGGVTEAEANVAERLRTAITGADIDARLGALRQLWDEEDALRRYARLILTAGAAGQIQPAEEQGGDADEIVASLFTAGMDGEAAAWSDVVDARGESSLAWALLAVGAPRPTVGLDQDRIANFGEGENPELQARMLAAALAGLGRVNDGVASGLGVNVAREDDWTRALDAAAAAGQPGTVALLSAIGMQSGDWSGVPPEHLYRIIRAMRQVGLEYEARMIAAEALTRL